MVVSVIIPTFNRAAALRRSLDSLVAQTINAFEVIVCDDGSTDQTEEVALSFRDRLQIVYSYEDNFGGPARPRNRGVRLAQSPLIAFLDSDDWWAPRKLEFSLRAIDNGADLVYHPLFRVKRSGQHLFFRKTSAGQMKRPIFTELLRRGNMISNSSVVIRRSVLERVGGFSEEKALIAVEDYDAWLRAAMVTDRFVCLGQPLGYYWCGGGNITNAERTLRSTAALEEKYRLEIGSLATPPQWIPYLKCHAQLQLTRNSSARTILSWVSRIAGVLPWRMRNAVLVSLVRISRVVDKLGRRLGGRKPAGNSR